MNYNNELYHYGVPGMKWGVRKRYEGKGGSYTKKGVKRFNESVSKYESAKKAYKNAKETGKTKYEIKYAKGKVKSAERQVKKDYKHLKLDKMADKGKIRYMKGERIRANSKVSSLLKKGSSLTLGAAYYANKLGYLSNQDFKKVATVTAVTFGSSYVYDYIKKRPNNELRAYYSHTSNY